MKGKRIIAVALAVAVAAATAQAGVAPATYVKAAKAPTISAKKATLYIGDTKTLKVKNFKASKVKWSSSKSKIVSVKKGKITAKAKGKATITAKCGKKKLTCKVTVKVGKLEFANNSISMVMSNGQYTLNAQYNGKSVSSSKIKWSSSDNKVATVSAGEITAKGEGTATITAVYNTAKATVKVTVTDDTKENEIKGEGLEIGKNVYSATEDDETIPVKVYFGGQDVTASVTWTTTNEDVISYDEGELSIGEAGEATITGTYNGQTVTAKVVVASAPASFDEDEDEDDIDEGDDVDDVDEGDDTDYGDDVDDSDDTDEGTDEFDDEEPEVPED